MFPSVSPWKRLLTLVAQILSPTFDFELRVGQVSLRKFMWVDEFLTNVHKYLLFRKSNIRLVLKNQNFPNRKNGRVSILHMYMHEITTQP